MAQTNPKVDAHIENAAPFAQPILRRIRKLYHKACPQIQETIKWGMPSFEHHGLVGTMAGEPPAHWFQNHRCSEMNGARKLE